MFSRKCVKILNLSEFELIFSNIWWVECHKLRDGSRTSGHRADWLHLLRFADSIWWPVDWWALLLDKQVGLVWQGGNGIDELLRDFDGPNSLTALRTRLGRRDSATQFSAISPPR